MPDIPKGKLGEVEITRVILGGNLLTRYTHCRDLGYVYSLLGKYNTDEKIVETFAAAEEHGINCVNLYTVDWAIDLLCKYKQDGGKIHWMHCPTASVENPDLTEYKEEIKRLADRGVELFYVWGEHSDVLVAQGKTDIIGRCLDIFRDCGVKSIGVGAHDLAVVKACEKANFDFDFYVKTFHHMDYPSAPREPEKLTAPQAEVPPYWCRNPEETIEVMRGVDKPWIAFKIMAAGSIPPKSAMDYIFKNGADFAFVGMFDYEIEEDVGIACEVLKEEMGKERARPWYG